MKLNIVPAKRGLEWVKLGIRIFVRQPMAMMGLFVTFMTAFALLSFLQLLGNLATLVLLPAVTMGYMVATHEALSGRFPMPTLLLAAFRAGRQRLRQMLILGGLYAVGFVCIISLSALIDGGQFAKLYLLGSQTEKDALSRPEVITAIYFTFALYLPMSLAFWHAPALIHWHGLSAVKSLFFSFVACMRNFRAFVVYGIAWFLITSAAGVLVSLLGILLGSPTVTSVLMLPAVLTVASMFFCSLFFTFHESFITEPSAPSTESAQETPKESS